MTQRKYLTTTSAALVAVVLALGAVIVVRHLTGFAPPMWLRVAVLAIVMAVVAVTTIGWWRALDEVAREAHKFAWYWGGSAGLVVSGAVMLLVDASHMPVPYALLPGQHGAFAVGAATVMMAQVAGYLVAWAGWWWSHR